MKLSERLREGTRDMHASAERSGAMRRLLRGELSRPHYALLLRQLAVIYARLEPALAHHAVQPRLAAIHDPRLARSAALAADLAWLAADMPADAGDALPEARAYGERIATLADEAPELLVAHAYVRYLGDLSGGQVLQRLVAAQYGFDAGCGTAFYRFEAPGAAALAAAFRTGLDAVPADETLAARIVQEARDAFARHERLFEALAQVPAVGA